MNETSVNEQEGLCGDVSFFCGVVLYINLETFVNCPLKPILGSHELKVYLNKKFPVYDQNLLTIT